MTTHWKSFQKTWLKRTVVVLLGLTALCMINTQQVKFYLEYEIQRPRIQISEKYMDCGVIRIKNRTNLLRKKVPNFLPRHKNPCWFNGRKLYCIPYMYLVGVAKCGTTDLFKRISLHPDFVGPTIKETNWLSMGLNGRGEGLETFASSFFEPLIKRLEKSNEGVRTQLITGEASINTMQNSYFWNQIGNNVGQDEPLEGNPEYIYHMNKDTKILFNVRNPIDRLWSEFLAFSRSTNKTAARFHSLVEKSVYLYNKCLETFTLRSCIYNRTLADMATMNSKEERKLRKCRHRIPTDIAVLRRGVYHVYIKDYLNAFPRDQVLVQRLEDISENPRASLEKTFEFLGLRKLDKRDMDSIFDMEVRNARKSEDRLSGKMWVRTRYLLHDYYKEHNRELALLLNDNRFDYQFF